MATPRERATSGPRPALGARESPSRSPRRPAGRAHGPAERQELLPRTRGRGPGSRPGDDRGCWWAVLRRTSHWVSSRSKKSARVRARNPGDERGRLHGLVRTIVIGRARWSGVSGEGMTQSSAIDRMMRSFASWSATTLRMVSGATTYLQSGLNLRAAFVHPKERQVHESPHAVAFYGTHDVANPGHRRLIAPQRVRNVHSTAS